MGITQVNPLRLFRQYLAKNDPGRVKGRFQLSNLPEHKGQPVLVFRFLEIISPVKRTTPDSDNGLVKPCAGQLLMRQSKAGKPRPWSYPLNSNRVHAQAWRRFLGLNGVHRDSSTQ